PGHAASAAELAVGKLEYLADLGGGSIAIVGEDFAEHRHAAGAVALVEDFLEVVACQFAGTRLDGPLDVVLGDAVGFGVVDGITEAEVLVGVAPAMFGCHD